MIDTIAGDAQLFASESARGAAAGVNAAGTALWGAAVEAGGSAAEMLLRQALEPVHAYRTSAARVQAALDEERVALPPPSPRPPSPPRFGVKGGVTTGVLDYHSILCYSSYVYDMFP